MRAAELRRSWGTARFRTFLGACESWAAQDWQLSTHQLVMTLVRVQLTCPLSAGNVCSSSPSDVTGLQTAACILRTWVTWWR